MKCKPALKLLNAGKGPNLGARHITLSTCGVVPGFAKLAAEGLQFELSVSLHAPNDELRSLLMPVNRRWPIDELLATCRTYTQTTGRIDGMLLSGTAELRGAIVTPMQALELSRLLGIVIKE